MAKVLRCKDVGTDCDFEVRAETKEDKEGNRICSDCA